jgi:flagellar export protein FliJ
MADLHALIRVRRHAVEQKQKVLGELYRKVEELETQKKELHETLAAERLKVDEMGVAALGYFGRYSEVVRERSDEIDEALKKLNNRIEIAREDMRIAFSELKKIEITQEAREKAEEKKRNKKESDLMDDIAIDGFRRKQEEEKSE